MAQAGGRAMLVLACGALLGDTPWRAPATTIAYLGAGSAQTDPPYINFQQAMRRWARPGSAPYTLQYHRIADAEPERIAQDVARVLAQRPAIVVAPTGDSALAAVRHGARQLVFASYPDPVHSGIVRATKQPGPGVTGVSLADGLHAKRLELMRDAYPGIRTVGVLADRSWWLGFQDPQALRQAAARHGLQLQVVLADTEHELNQAMQNLGPDAPDAWYVPATYLAYFAEATILQHLQRLGRPSMHTTLGEVARGAPMAYVQDTRFVFDAMADLTHRVLGGADAGSIPVQGPRQLVLAVRPRDSPVALRLHPSVVRRADRVY
jgi:putative tryptophan/tyrosine transport system substrate-binding protein